MDLGAVTSFFSSLSIDWLILGAITIFVALDALRSGTGRAAAVLCALPASLLLWKALPSAFFVGNFIDGLPQSWGPLVVFVVIVVAMYVLSRQIIGDASSFSSGPLQALIAGVAVTAVLTVIWLQMPQLSNIWDFGQSIESLFAGKWSFYWLLASFGALGFARQ